MFEGRVSDKSVSERSQRILTVAPLKRPSKYDMVRGESQDAG